MFYVSWRWVLLCGGRTRILFLHMENQYWTICHCGIGGRRSSTSNRSPRQLFDLLVPLETHRSTLVREMEGRFSHFRLWHILREVKHCLDECVLLFLKPGCNTLLLEKTHVAPRRECIQPLGNADHPDHRCCTLQVTRVFCLAVICRVVMDSCFPHPVLLHLSCLKALNVLYSLKVRVWLKRDY